jgi:hypothetical protein
MANSIKGPYVGWVGDAYTARSERFNASQTINMYPEKNDAALSPAKESQIAVLMSVPGKTLRWDSQLNTGVRGLWQPSNSPNVAFAVIGSSLYRITSGVDPETGLYFGVTLVAGQLITSSGQVSIADNGQQVVIVDGTYGYWVDIGGSTLTQITDGHFYPASSVDFIDGYFVFNRSGTTQCFYSDLYSVAFPTLNLFAKTSSSDNVVGLKVNVGQIYLFGEKNTEVWFNAGGAVTPFSRVSGKFIPFGCVASHTIKNLNGTIIWLGRDNQGSGMVYTLNGDVATRISTHAVEFSLQEAGADLSASTAYTQQIDGHMFYCLQVPGLGKTWCFDMTEPAWHVRQTNRNGVTSNDRAINHMFFNGEHIVGDDQTGQLFVLDFETYTDGEYPLVRTRQAPHVSKQLDRNFFNMLEVDFKFGVGTNGEGYGTNPVAVLNISDDGGLTFGPDISVELGKIGQYLVRAQWWRLGYSADRVFRVSVSDPVSVQMLSAQLIITPGNS